MIDYRIAERFWSMLDYNWWLAHHWLLVIFMGLSMLPILCNDIVLRKEKVN